ncbi:MAG: DUF397 domain-containing protein [Stackebrandtia sp.]
MTISGPWRKSSRSTGTSGSCVEARMTGEWRKSSRSGGTSGTCVEARMSGRVLQVRDSNLGDASPILDLTAHDFVGLLNAVQH